jgi:glutathione synthase/RimK-type ligase-like ATP-grasp enzyme
MSGGWQKRARTIALVTGSIALVTCAQLAEGEDAQVLGLALSALGMRSCWQVWDDPAVDWSAFDLAVLRSTWDYPANRHRFVAWAESVPRLANAVDVVAWNSDKRYLRDVAAAGVPVVPSEWSDPGEPVDLPIGEFVVKPSVGAGSRGVGRFGPGAHAAARSHVAALHDVGRAVMVQPYLADVETAGEIALIYLDGAFSHAVRKAAMLSEVTVHDVAPEGPTGLFVPQRITAHRPDPEELDLGGRVIALLRERFGGDLFYARIDVVPTPGGLVMLELELVEPSLFLQYDQDAAARFAAAVRRRL